MTSGCYVLKSALLLARTMYYPIDPKTRTRTFRTRLILVLLALTLLPMHTSAQRRHRSPVLSATVPLDATARCHDGYYSFSRHRRGTCSGHGGVAEWLGRFALHEVQPQPPALTATTSSPQYTNCDPTLWQHVYHPRRLRIIEGCVTVTGTVASVAPEADGDLHIRLTLDAGFSRLLNDKNLSAQGGSLVVEPVCIRAVAQRDARTACQNFHQTILIPKVGDHISVTGVHVLDTYHGWSELHPVTSITISPCERAEPPRVLWDFLLIACIGSYLHRPYNDISLHQQHAGSCDRRKHAPRLSLLLHDGQASAKMYGTRGVGESFVSPIDGVRTLIGLEQARSSQKLPRLFAFLATALFRHLYVGSRLRNRKLFAMPEA